MEYYLHRDKSGPHFGTQDPEDLLLPKYLGTPEGDGSFDCCCQGGDDGGGGILVFYCFCIALYYPCKLPGVAKSELDDRIHKHGLRESD